MHLRHHLPLSSPPIWCSLASKRYQSTSKPVPNSANEDITLRAALRGTVPEHQSLLLLHTKTPPEEWPRDVSRVSPLLREILPHVKGFQGKVLMYYPGDEFLKSRSTNLMTKGQSKDYRPYTATYFAKLHPPFDIPLLSPDLLPQFLDLFRSRMQTGVNVASLLEPPGSQVQIQAGSRASGSGSGAGSEREKTNIIQARSLHRSSLKSQDIDRKRVKKTWILVCAHGARDCRCGERGPVVAERMRKYVNRRGLERSVVIGEVSHVGGHRYAPNVLVYPEGDWYGTLEPSEVESFMESLLGVEDEDSLSGPQSPLWRGSWFDHRGVPSAVDNEDSGVQDTTAGALHGPEGQRLHCRIELELMRAARDASLEPRGMGAEGELEDSWGLDLDRLRRGD